MEPQEKLTARQFIIDRLHDIQRKAEANNYTDALASIKEVKASDVKNIYLIALEKQIAKLSDTSLPAENRIEIIKSLPSMIDRAISDVQRRASAPKADEAQKGQKEAALEKLKRQYFQRADDYVEKQEYQHALEEIRRIYIIEPGSVVAKEYEQKIGQLAALHARWEAQKTPTAEAIGADKSLSAAESTKEKIVLEKEPGKSKLPLIAAAVVVLAVGAWFFFSRSSNGTQAEQELTQQPSILQESISPASTTTTTPEPQSKNEIVAITETPKPSAKTQTERPVVKSAAPEQKPAQSKVTPVAKAPVTTQQQAAQQAQQSTQQPPAQQQQAIQPVVNTPPPQTAQQEVKTAESTPAPVPFVAVETQPEIIKRVAPKYPDTAVKLGIQGTVYIEVTIDAQGKPTGTKIIKGIEVFNDAAIEAAMKYTFKPATMSTGPVPSKMTVPFIFSIKR